MVVGDWLYYVRYGLVCCLWLNVEVGLWFGRKEILLLSGSSFVVIDWIRVVWLLFGKLVCLIDFMNKILFEIVKCSFLLINIRWLGEWFG